MKKTLENLLRNNITDLGDAAFIIEHPDDLKNGDYSTNVALVLAKNQWLKTFFY